MTALRRTALALTLAIAALFGTATAAQAATGSWYDYEASTNPTAYWTNQLSSGGPALSAGFTVPAGATITTVDFDWRMQGPPPSGTSLYVYACWGTSDDYCTDVSPNFNTASWSGTTSDFAGLPANESFHFHTVLAAPTTYSLAPNYYRASSTQVTVNYTY